MDKSSLAKSIEDWQEYYLNQLASSFKRDLELRMPNRDLALCLIGLRRSGKTTLAIQLSAALGKGKVFYYNFEDPLFTASSTTADLDLLIETAEELSRDDLELLILDEIHNVPLWEKWLRKLIDLKRYRIIITGSSAKLLRSDLATALTGRVISREVWPLSLLEYAGLFKAKPSRVTIPRLCKEYLTYGGFPAVALERNTLQKREILRSYFTDILLRDVAAKNKVRNVKALQDLATFILTNLSSLHSSTSLEKALGIDKETVLLYLSFLAEAFLVNTCELHTNNLKVQQRAATKYYLSDLGLRLVGARSSNPDEGKLLENLVYLELRRANQMIYYFKEQQEVDFLVCDGYKPDAAYQVSYSLKDPDTREREINGLIEVSKRHELSDLYIITWNETEMIKTEGLKIKVLPVWRFVGLD
jgi:predicted AAA+ superfamily ATPase